MDGIFACLVLPPVPCFSVETGYPTRKKVFFFKRRFFCMLIGLILSTKTTDRGSVDKNTPVSSTKTMDKALLCIFAECLSPTDASPVSLVVRIILV